MTAVDHSSTQVINSMRGLRQSIVPRTVVALFRQSLSASQDLTDTGNGRWWRVASTSAEPSTRTGRIPNLDRCWRRVVITTKYGRTDEVTVRDPYRVDGRPKATLTEARRACFVSQLHPVTGLKLTSRISGWLCAHYEAVSL
jgi:hypothetical protein